MGADMQLGLELSQRQCCLQGKIYWLTSQNNNYRDGKNADGIKSANSASKLSNKRCPLICIKDQTIPLWIFQQAGESGPSGQSVTVVSYDHTGHGHGPSTTKNFQSNFLKQELRNAENASGRLKSANSWF